MRTNPAFVNLIADAVVERLRDINRLQDRTRWLTTFKSVERALSVAAIANIEPPALRVMVGTWSNDLPAVSHEEARWSFNIIVNVVTADVANPDQVLQNACSDVVSAFTDDPRLGTLLESGWIYPQRCDPVPEHVDLGNGRGVAQITLLVTNLLNRDRA